MSRWDQFFKNIQQDLKLFIFTLSLLCVFRIAFIVILNRYVNVGTTLPDIMSALYYGLRISLKSAGVITLLSFLFCTVLNILIKNKKIAKIRYVLGSIYIVILTFLFHARIPYYEEFHAVFDQIIFNTFKDDIAALFFTLVQQYHLPLRLLSVAIFSFLFCKMLKAVLRTKTVPSPRFTRWYATAAFRTALMLLIALFMVFARFGGSLTYAKSVHWENAAVSKDAFLNEAILDDVQALYRAYIGYERLRDAKGLNVDAGKIADYAAKIAGQKMATNNIEDYFKKEAQGAKIPKPKHIFVIVGESYAEWPLLPKYNDLHIADGVKQITEKNNAVFVQAFLPAGSGTAQSLNGMITGLAEVNLYPNYQPESYKQPYATAMAAQMKKLGYKTYFWYGGFSSWQKMKDLALSQGFDEFYGCNDLPGNTGNAWGMEDKHFLNALAAAVQDDQPSFHVIMTTSNHPPYTVNLEQEGFDANYVLGSLPDDIKNDNEWKQKLGHFWYADKAIADFVNTVQQKHPDTLFVITGDHADRMNIEPNPDLFERYTIPLILYGKGITKDILPKNAAGTHLSITPTLIELIAPKGFTYYSITPSLTNGNKLGINHGFWITDNYIGKTDAPAYDVLPWTDTSVTPPGLENLQPDIDAIRAVSWWRIQKGKNMN